MVREYGTAFDATTVRGLQDGTLDGYLRQLRRLARLERMQPGDGARGILEARLMQVVQGDLSESAAKIVLAAARLAEKMEWLAPVVRKSNWYLVMSIEQRRCKEQRAEAKEWAQLEDLCRLCAAASSFAEWEAVALACVSVGHCLRGSEAGGGLGQEDEGVRFFGGGPETGSAALGARMVTVSGETQGTQGVPPQQGGVARVQGSAGEDVGQRAGEGGGEENCPVAEFP